MNNNLPKTNKGEIVRFEELLGAIREQLVLAQGHLDIWIDIFPTEEVVHVINAYRRFFQFTREAHRSQFFVSICNSVAYPRHVKATEIHKASYHYC